MACEPEGGIWLFVLNLITQHVTDLLLCSCRCCWSNNIRLVWACQPFLVVVPVSLPGSPGFEVVSATPDVVVPLLYHGGG